MMKSMKMKKPKQVIAKSRVVELLLASRNVAIYTHINTDCDAVGSSLALRDVLMSLGKKVDVFVHSTFPTNFKVFGDLSFYNKKTCEETYDLAVCLDCAAEARLGKYQYTYKKGLKNSLQIDHHDAANEMYCRDNYVVHASSTAEIMFDIFKEMKVELSPYASKCLIAGIETDTGKFSYATSSSTFETMSSLIKTANCKMEEINVPLFSSMKREVFELMKHAYQKVEFYSDGRLSLLMFKYDDFVKTGTSLDDVGIFPEITMQLECVEFAILASEDDKGYYRVSFRSKGDISARAVAETFGGGGHLNASGCKIFGEFEDVKQQLLTHAFETLGWKR